MTFLSKVAFRAWLVVALLWPVACLNYLDRLMITTMRDSIKAEIVMTDAQFGLLTSVFLWVYALLSPSAGFLADRFGRSRVIIGSLFVWSAVTWLTGHARDFNQLLAARALMGISEACYMPAALALITDYHRGPTRSLATGLHISGLYAGAALGGLGGFLAEHFRWQSAFSLFGAVGVGYSILLVLALRDDRGVADESPTGSVPGAQLSLSSALSYLLRRPSFLALLAYFSLLSIAYWAIYGWLPTYLGEHFKLGQGAAGLSATAYLQVASFAGIVAGGAWADRWARRNLRGRLYVPLIGFCLAGPALFLAASTDVLRIAIGGLIVFGMARGFADANNMPILCQIADRRHRATGYGVMNFVSCILGGLMTYAAGALNDAQVGLQKVFQYCSAGVVIAVLLLLLIKPKRELEET
jgi:MFS transporter, Spinster family, sphingosine-1-phosphate transporter